MFLELSLIIVLLTVSIIVESKRKQKVIHLMDIVVLMFVVFLFLRSSQNETMDYTFMILAGVFLLLCNLLGEAGLLKNKSIQPFLPLIGLLLFFIPSGEFKVDEFQIEFNSYTILLLMTGAYLVPLISKVLIKWLKISEKPDLKLTEQSIVLLLISGLITISFFMASYSGVLALSVGFAAYTIYTKEKYHGITYSLFMVLLIYPVLSMGGLYQIDLSLGKIIGGLLTGIALGTVYFLFAPTKKWFIPPVLILIALSIILLLGTQKSDLGGVDVYLAVLIGMALSGIKEQTLYRRASFIALSLLPLLTFNLFAEKAELSTTENQEMKITATEKENTFNTVDYQNQKSIQIDSVLGEYVLSNEELQFNFELGPRGGRTKGKIKELKGNVNLKSNLKNSEFDIEIPVKALSTMNKFRDENLMGPDYFNSAIYPVMKFESSKMKLIGDEYEVEGKFELLGITKAQKVTIKFIDPVMNQGKRSLIMIGQGSIDRTQFGMKPDPKEGNVVDFVFKIRLTVK